MIGMETLTCQADEIFSIIIKKPLPPAFSWSNMQGLLSKGSFASFEGEHAAGHEHRQELRQTDALRRRQLYHQPARARGPCRQERPRQVNALSHDPGRRTAGLRNDHRAFGI